jgi:hypothetical protein
MAKTFNYGAGIWATKTGSSMAYNDQNDNYKPTPFSVTRDSIATRVNKEGLIEVVGKDKLRIDYTDSSNGVALLEPARTNDITYSEDFSDSGWTKTGTTSVSLNDNISPDGTQNASTVSGLTGSGSNDLYFITGENPASKTYSFSVYLKGEGTLRLQISNNVNQGINETVTLTSDWKRHTVSGTFNSTSGNLSATLDDSGATATEYKIWGAQLEEGSYATSYIPTSGQSGGVTRAADVANGAGNEQVFNDSEGVLFADIAAIDDAETNNRRLGLTKNNTFEGLRIQYNGSTIGAVLYDGSTNQYSQTFTFDKLSLFAKVAFKYKASDFALWINGFEYGAQASGTTLSEGTLDDLSFDYVNGNFFFGKAKEIGYYDAVLTDAELEALTSYTSFTNMANELNLTIK